MPGVLFAKHLLVSCRELARLEHHHNADDVHWFDGKMVLGLKIRI